MTAEKGTRGYMAPEVYDETEYGEAADVFSTAATIFELANLKPAYTGTAAQIMKKLLIRRAGPEPFAEMCPEELRPIIIKGLELDPEDRPTMALIVRDLEAIKSSEKFVVGELKQKNAELTAENAQQKET